MSVVAMLVESYALESVWSLVAAILYGLDSPLVVLFMGNDSTVKVREPAAEIITPLIDLFRSFRSSPTSLLFIVLRPDEDGPQKPNATSQAYNGIAVHWVPLMGQLVLRPAHTQGKIW